VFDHVTIRASDREASERFYDLVLATIGVEKTHADEHYPEWGDFSLAQADGEHPATRRLHIGFVAPSREGVDAFWQAGTDAGYRDDGAPGLRPEYSESYYGAFLLDPDGNSAEAVHHDSTHRRSGNIDHLWIRVADVAAAKRFYETVGPLAGFVQKYEVDDRVGFGTDTGSFSLVHGEPTEHVHLAFPARENEAVEEFHRAAVEAGYRDNGRPGERSVYHPGYYAAYVLDPDGNNVEVVNHNR
jgi:catechol 2,3-dioxygenase-like lactoylglutathione lyase family enzyme